MSRLDRNPVIPAQAGIHDSGTQAFLDARFRGHDGEGQGDDTGSPPPHCHPLDRDHCATCADEGIEAVVLAVRGDSIAEVAMEGRTEEVAIDLVDAVRPGDRILVHAGVALTRLES